MKALWWLDPLLKHEIHYFAFAGSSWQTDCAWYLFSETLPKYHDANRALRLRDDGRGPRKILQEVVAVFKQHRRWPIVIDIDPVAEEQGFLDALLREGALQNRSRYPLYAYKATQPPLPPSPQVWVAAVPAYDEEARQIWVELQICDERTEEERQFWRAVAEAESRFSGCRLYLAYIEESPVGACDLFSMDGWARIDSVITHPEWRRRGVASALVTRAIADALAEGNQLVYLFTEAGGPAESLYRRLGFERLHEGPLHRHLLLA
ncbi:GNAT family N-acetyltransferase [Chthonomonas calidirosea]|uniref:GNAT family N-acetyltransferase n=1 Tax=Chthonomonas calidirosea TaxID=454171 RepID=UPI0006ECA193|nr:GNAT family N-acetyltransferase [Chthonomonas calidirosea]CEK18658.1 predicted acyltransferase [Chthonomonas calidirosea]